MIYQNFNYLRLILTCLWSEILASISFVPKTPINNSAFVVVVVIYGIVIAQFNLFINKVLIFHAL